MPSKADENLPPTNEGYGTKEYCATLRMLKSCVKGEWMLSGRESPGTSFDWFLSPEYLLPFIEELCPDRTARVLMLGCGNSRLSEVLYDAGYTEIVNTDYSKAVIDDMSARHASRDKMKWVEMDVLNLEFEDESFDLVIDKGTMDAMLTTKGDPWNPPEKDVEACTREIDEAVRVLKRRRTSRFLYFTFGQPHFRKRYMQGRAGWTLSHREIGPKEGFAYFLYVLEYAGE